MSRSTHESPDTRREAQPITQIEREGELLFAFGDADRHERRVQRAVFGGADRLFWGTIAIACGAPGEVVGLHDERLGNVAKSYGTLAKARNDLRAFYQYYRPLRLGSPFIVGATPGLGKSSGYFDYTADLDNPTTEEVDVAIRGLREWLEVNQNDPEYTSFQLNLCFSGHGDVDEHGRAGMVVADGVLGADDMTARLLSCLPEQELVPATCRLDLFLDCCHSGAIAHEIHMALGERQRGVDPLCRSVLEVGQVYCACLDDESSFELADLMHSVFTFAFLNECSRRPPEGAATMNIGLRDVGWITGGAQHPLLVDFTAPGGWAMKFPSQYYVTHRLPLGGTRSTGPSVQIEADALGRDPLGELLRVARALRGDCLEAEQRLRADEHLRFPFSRDEVLTNKRFPFL